MCDNVPGEIHRRRFDPKSARYGDEYMDEGELNGSSGMSFRVKVGVGKSI